MCVLLPTVYYVYYLCFPCPVRLFLSLIHTFVPKIIIIDITVRLT